MTQCSGLESNTRVLGFHWNDSKDLKKCSRTLVLQAKSRTETCDVTETGRRRLWHADTLGYIFYLLSSLQKHRHQLQGSTDAIVAGSLRANSVRTRCPVGPISLSFACEMVFCTRLGFIRHGFLHLGQNRKWLVVGVAAWGYGC